ncbi:prepilin peptidase [Allohahella sp. A8]|uniref:prepilin peptidase n=1 Tax=Allohahella sp. A8 TaxID=3141461 RepID=UPI003A812507
MTEFFQYLQQHPNAAFFFIAVFGLLIGSFLNVVIYRLPRMMEAGWLQQCEQFLADHQQRKAEAAAGPTNHNTVAPDLTHEADAPAEQAETTPVMTLSKPDSTCPHCGHKIRAWENIPVLSYLALRGRCSSCKATISLRYPVIELVTALLGVICLKFIGVNMAGLAAVALSWTLLTLSMIDFDTKLLPDSITMPLLWAGLIANSFGLFTDLESAIWGAIGGYMSLWLVFHGFRLLTGKEGMGYGDFKLLAALGAWLGWQVLPLIILLSSLVGAIIGIGLIVIRGRDRNIPIPFGPYLAIAGFIALLWGNAIISSYLSTL